MYILEEIFSSERDGLEEILIEKWWKELREKNPFVKNSIEDSVEKGRISNSVRAEKGEISCIFPSMTLLNSEE